MNHLRLPFAYRSISHALKALNVWPVILALTNQEFSRLGFSTATFLVLGTTMPYIKSTDSASSSAAQEHQFGRSLGLIRMNHNYAANLNCYVLTSSPKNQEQCVFSIRRQALQTDWRGFNVPLGLSAGMSSWTARQETISHRTFPSTWTGEKPQDTWNGIQHST